MPKIIEIFHRTTLNPKNKKCMDFQNMSVIVLNHFKILLSDNTRFVLFAQFLRIFFKANKNHGFSKHCCYEFEPNLIVNFHKIS